MAAISAYARDVWQVKSELLRRGFKQAVDYLNSMPQAQAEAVIGAAMTLQYDRMVSRGKRDMSLCEKIRVEQGWDYAELAKAIQEFHDKDLNEQQKEMRQQKDQWAKDHLTPDDYDLWKRGCCPIDEIEQRFRTPERLTFTENNMLWLERDRPHRHERNPQEIAVIERFFASLTGFAIGFEELMSDVGIRDPRARRVPEIEKKRNKKSPEDAVQVPPENLGRQLEWKTEF